jgi:hypothetical protein
MNYSSFLPVLLALVMGLCVLIQESTAICANSSWITCADSALATFAVRKGQFESSIQSSNNITTFYCNHTVTYYQSFASCTTTNDCWNFPFAIKQRSQRYNITECTSESISGILGGTSANCVAMSCSDLLPGSIQPTFAPTTKSHSTITTAGTLAAISILVASLTF